MYWRYQMISKKIQCPNCQHIISIAGQPGQKMILTCPNCTTKGQYRFPGSPKEEDKSNALSVCQLSKQFKEVLAVNDLTFKVKTGEVFGFLGPNGAGKSTTIKSILGLIHPTKGEIRINGYNIKTDEINARKNIGYLPERVAFFENLTPIQTLRFFCELKGVSKSIIPSLLKQVGLSDAANRKVGTFSKGMVQLLGVAQVMIGNPSVYILDEPMSGLDARWVKIIRDKIRMLNEQGATVIFSSHILTEVENPCDRVAIINNGKLIAIDSVDNLNRHLRIRPRLELTIPGLKGVIPEKLQNFDGIEDIWVKQDVLYINCESTLRSTIIALLENAGMHITHVKTVEPSLEDAFVKLIDDRRGDQ